MISLCACLGPKTEKCILQIYADSSLNKELPLVGDKFLVTDGKGYNIQYCFDTPKNLLERIQSGEPCDLLITASDQVRNQLVEDGKISAEKSIELLRSPMALITSSEHPSRLIDMKNLFYQTEYVEDEEYEEEEVEGYRRYLDVLWETTEEEQWQDEWNERYDGLWIAEQVQTIGILSPEEKEGQCAIEILNNDGRAFELLDQIGRIRAYDTDEALLEAVRNSDVQAGICSLTNTFDDKKLQILTVYNDSNSMVTFYVSAINDSENRKEAKDMMTFLQGDHARRFFEDFGFQFMR